MTFVLFLMGLLKANIKEVNVKAIDLIPTNSIVEKVESKQEQQSKVNKGKHRRHGSKMGM